MVGAGSAKPAKNNWLRGWKGRILSPCRRAPTLHWRNAMELPATLSPCIEAAEWLASQPDPQTAWQTCRRSDWMLWLLKELNYADDKVLRLYACWCARETPLVDGRKVWDLLTDARSRTAVEVAERFAVGAATQDELDAASDAASDAARAASAAWAAASDDAWGSTLAAAWASAWASARAAQADQLRVMAPFSVVEALLSKF